MPARLSLPSARPRETCLPPAEPQGHVDAPVTAYVPHVAARHLGVLRKSFRRVFERPLSLREPGLPPLTTER